MESEVGPDGHERNVAEFKFVDKDRHFIADGLWSAAR